MTNRWVRALSGCLCFALLPALSAQAQQPAASLTRLIRAQGVSGFETDVRNEIRALLPPWARGRVDEIGNLIVTIGQGQPHLLLATSIDEDGYVVSRIMDDGFLRLQRTTTGVANRLFEQYHYGQPVMIRTTRGRFAPGVIGSASQHLQRGREQSAAIKGLDDLWVDVGAESSADVAEMGIQLLDTVTLRERVEALADGRVAGVASQARASALTLLSLLQPFDQAPAIVGTLTVAWATQASFGEKGFARLAQEIEAGRVLIVARSAVAKDMNAKGSIGRLGSGPLISESDTATIAQAKAAGIPIQVVSPGLLRLPGAWPASKTQAVALPVQFMQTPVETVALADVTSLASLLQVVVGLRPPASKSTPPTAALAPPSPPADVAHPAEPEILATLRPLIEAYGVSGHETPVRDLVLKKLPRWAKPEIDSRGNVTVTFGQGGRELVFVAHLDELGYELTGILDDGTATVRNRGGMSDLGHEAHPMLVHTARGIVPAVVAPRPDYLRATDGRLKPEEVVLCFGTSERAATDALGVAVGDSVTVRKSLVTLGANRATARSIDDRNGVAALLAAINGIDPGTIQNRVTFAWVVGEEIGLVGSGFLAERLHPAWVFAIDTFVSSDSPLDPQRFAHVPLGSGAVVRAMDTSSITPPEAVARIVEVARAHRIPVSVGTTNGGNDGSTFSQYGVVVAPISWPGRYSHSPVEVMDIRDLDALTQLITALAGEPKW